MCVGVCVCVCACDRCTDMAPVPSQFCLQALYLFVSWQRGGMRSTPPSHPPRSPLSHALIVMLYFYLFYFSLWFFYSQDFFRSEHTHICAPAATAKCVFYELWTTKRAVAASVRKICIKLQIRALTCSGETQQLNQATVSVLEQICLITRFCG